METNIKENNIEKSLVKQKETSLRTRNVQIISSAAKLTIGILFYTATFIISMAISTIFIFTIAEP